MVLFRHNLPQPTQAQLMRDEFPETIHNTIEYIYHSICGQHAVSFFLNSSAQHRGNEAEPDSNGKKKYHCVLISDTKWAKITPSIANKWPRICENQA